MWWFRPLGGGGSESEVGVFIQCDFALLKWRIQVWSFVSDLQGLCDGVLWDDGGWQI
jgi:hypothetical protein